MSRLFSPMGIYSRTTPACCLAAVSYEKRRSIRSVSLGLIGNRRRPIEWRKCWPSATVLVSHKMLTP
jgi:hypothetical protein